MSTTTDAKRLELWERAWAAFDKDRDFGADGWRMDGVDAPIKGSGTGFLFQPMLGRIRQRLAAAVAKPAAEATEGDVLELVVCAQALWLRSNPPEESP